MAAEFDPYVLRRFYDKQYQRKRNVETTVLGFTPQMGPVGHTGPSGSQGPTGARGVNGINGNNGATGPTGAAGTVGYTGPRGATGPAGTAGALGTMGATGPIGTTGTTGLTGLAGASGATGAIGITGATGADGARGATGPSGANFSYASTTISALSNVAVNLTLTTPLYSDLAAAKFNNRYLSYYGISFKGIVPLANFRTGNLPTNSLLIASSWTSFASSTPVVIGPSFLTYNSSTGVFTKTTLNNKVLWEATYHICTKSPGAGTAGGNDLLLFYHQYKSGGTYYSIGSTSGQVSVVNSTITYHDLITLPSSVAYNDMRVLFSFMRAVDAGYPADAEFEFTINYSFREILPI